MIVTLTALPRVSSVCGLLGDRVVRCIPDRLELLAILADLDLARSILADYPVEP